MVSLSKIKKSNIRFKNAHYNFISVTVNITGFQLFGYGSNASRVTFGGIEASIDYTTSSPSFISLRIGSNSNLTNSTNVTISIISNTYAIVQSSSSWTYLKEGVIDSVTPSRGQFGSLVTINGTNLLGGGISISQIYIDGVPPNVVSFNENQILIALGDHTTRTDGIPSGEVYIESNTGAIIRGGTFEQLLPGNITSFSPLSGRLGTIVTIYGFNLKGYGSAITNVTVAGYPALSDSFETDSSDSTLVISIDNAPNGTSGPIRIHINTGAVIESSESFTYTEPGSISTVSPTTGSEGVGLLITGSLLEVGPVITNVTIGGSEVLRIVTNSPNQVTVIAGPAPIVENSLLVRVISSDGSYVEGGAFSYQNLSLSIAGQNTGQYGTQVTLNAPFPATEVLSVYFDNQEAAIIITQQIDNTSSTVAVTAPRPQRLDQFTVDVSVENNRHIFARLVNGFTYLPEGAIYTVSPSFGQRGTIITLTGERLQGGGDSVIAVDVGGVAATISNYSDSYVSISLNGNLPNGQSSFSDITIISNTGATVTRLDGFMFIQPGQITSISPLSGQYGTIVTLRGTGLLQGNMNIISVTVAGNEAQLMGSPNDTYIIVQLMHGMQETGSVIITLDSGAQISSNGLQFSYITAGNITSVSPPVGTVGTIVSIMGTNLRGGGMEAATVKLNGVPATIISDSDTLITVEAGIANVSSGSVEIISNTGSIVSAENSWTYEKLGNITTVYPQSGQQGVSVTIEGLSLIGSSGTGIIEVMLAGIPATIVSQTNATVQVIAGYSNSSVSGPIVMREATGPVIISSFNWLYYEAELSTISPSTGVNGTYVLLNGTNIIGEPNSFYTVSGVSFGSIPAYDVTVLSRNLVRVRAGHSPVATVPLTIQINSTSGAYLTLTDQWVFREPGQVVEIEPLAAIPGKNVTIRGTSLVPDNATGVTVVTGQTESFEAWIINSSVVTFRVGLYASYDDPNVPLPLLIVANDGATLKSDSPTFTFNSVNTTVTSVAPIAGGEGSVVIINGTNLLNGGSIIRSVYLAGVPVTDFSVNADYTSIEVTAGAGDNTEGSVVIENDNDILYGNYTWTYLPALTSNQVLPTTGRNGTSVGIDATSLSPQYTLQSATIGGMQASIASTANGIILLIAPPMTSNGSIVLYFQDGIYLIISNSWISQPTINITSVSTLFGYYGTIVTLSGSGFQGGVGIGRVAVGNVTLAGFNTSILSQNDTELRVRIDDNFNSSGSGNITGPIIIRGQDGSMYYSSSQDIAFTYLDVSIESISPSNGQNGTEVIIKGTNLLGGGNDIHSFSLASISVFSINMVSSSIINVTAGYSDSEIPLSDISYVTDNGAQVTIPNSWGYVQPGEMKSVSPTSGQKGRIVTITGERMLGGGQSVRSVTLNGVSAMEILVSHNDFIQVRAGESPASSPGQVIITANTGAVLYSNATEVSFGYITPGYIDTFSPTTGQYGTIVTINGTGLYSTDTGIDRVLLNNVQATILSSNPTYVTVAAGRPAFIAMSSGTIMIISKDGSVAESSGLFTYGQQGEIYSIEPPQGQKGTRIVISGRRLRGGGSEIVSASIAGTPATIINESDDTIQLIANENEASQTSSVIGEISLISNTGAEVIRLDAWSYVQTGVVHSLSPSFGQYGTYISITGERLTAGGDSVAQVLIDDIPSLTVESSNDTLVIFRAGQSTNGSGLNATAITLISNYGGNLTQMNVSWRYGDASEIVSISPVNGTGASIVNITGSDLLGGGSSIVNVILAGINVREIFNSSNSYVIVEAGFNPNGQPKLGDVRLEADTGALTVLMDGWSYISECPHGQFGNDSESCNTCHPECNHCYGPSQFECYACINFKITREGQGFECVASCPSVSTLNKDCIDECATFEYRVNLTNDGHIYCLNCSSLCDPNSGCTGPHPSQCAACAYYKERGECVSQCSIGSYISNGTCLPCSQQCLPTEDCYGPQATQCNACLNVSITRHNENSSFDECIPDCPANHYTDSEYNQCQACHSLCIGGCTGPTSSQCIQCTDAYVLGSNNTRECVEDCNGGSGLKTRYKDPSTGECKACNQYCSITEGCTGPTASDCISCSNFTLGTHVLSTEFIPKLNGECIPLCPNESYYIEVRNGNCEFCDSSCFAGCTGPSENDCILISSSESPTLSTESPSTVGAFSAGTGIIIIFAVAVGLLIIAFIILLVILLAKTKGKERKNYNITGPEPRSYTRNPISEMSLSSTNPYISGLEVSVMSELAPPRPSRTVSFENPAFRDANIELLEEDETNFGRSLDNIPSRPISPDRPSSPDADEHSSLLGRGGGGDVPPPVPVKVSKQQRGSQDSSGLRQNSVPEQQPQNNPPLNFIEGDSDDGEMYIEMDPATSPGDLELMTQDEYVDVSSPLPQLDIPQEDGDGVYEETDSTAPVNVGNITSAIQSIPFRQVPLPSVSQPSKPPAIPPKQDPNQPALPPRPVRKSSSSTGASSSEQHSLLAKKQKQDAIIDDPQTIEEYYEEIDRSGGNMADVPPKIVPRQKK